MPRSSTFESLLSRCGVGVLGGFQSTRGTERCVFDQSFVELPACRQCHERVLNRRHALPVEDIDIRKRAECRQAVALAEPVAPIVGLRSEVLALVQSGINGDVLSFQLLQLPAKLRCSPRFFAFGRTAHVVYHR